MGVSGGSRRLLRKTGLARESQQDAINRLYSSHQQRTSRPPPPPVDDHTGQPLFHPVVNHKPPRVAGDNAGSGHAQAQVDLDDESVVHVTANAKQRAAEKLYENALARLSRQENSVAIQNRMCVLPRPACVLFLDALVDACAWCVGVRTGSGPSATRRR